MDGTKTSFIQRHADTLFLGLGILLAALLRFTLLPHPSYDITEFFGPWYEFIQKNGGWGALKYNFANYTPPYLYLQVIASQIFPRLESVYAIKLFPVAFDFIAAFFVYKLVRLRYPTGTAPWLAGLAVLFAPTVILNSSFWGQTDIIYTTGLLACIYFLAIKRDVLALIAFGLAISIKLQAAFLLPFLAVLVLMKQVSWKNLLLVPLVYLILILPAWMAGRPLIELLEVYFEQSTTYHALTMNAANMYQWLPNDLYALLYPAGMVLAASVALLYVWVASKRGDLRNPATLVSLALISVIIMPYFTPKMHDRYFFAADVLSVIFAFYYPRYFYLPILICGVSFFSYTQFLFEYEIVPLRYLAIVQLVTVVILFRYLASGTNFAGKVGDRDSSPNLEAG